MCQNKHPGRANTQINTYPRKHTVHIHTHTHAHTGHGGPLRSPGGGRGGGRSATAAAAALSCCYCRRPPPAPDAGTRLLRKCVLIDNLIIICVLKLSRCLMCSLCRRVLYSVPPRTRARSCACSNSPALTLTTPSSPHPTHPTPPHTPPIRRPPPTPSPTLLTRPTHSRVRCAFPCRPASPLRRPAPYPTCSSRWSGTSWFTSECVYVFDKYTQRELG